MGSHRTLAERFEFEADPIKGSRFVALLAPVQTDAEALAELEAARRRWPGATHHCWAYALSDGRSRSSDDGEPGGSAGRPILAQIEGHDVTDVSAVVVRWYGGTKLGVGGLIRAYGGTAGKALDRAPIEVVEAMIRLRVTHAYDDTGPIQALIGSRNLTVEDTEWGERVTLTLSVREDEAVAITAELTDRTAGRAQISQPDALPR